MTKKKKKAAEIQPPVIGDAMGGILEEHLIDGLEAEVPAERAEKALLAAENYIDFVEYTFPKYKTEEFHRSVAHQLGRVTKGEIKRLMIFAPPQHGKSELISTRFPAWWLAKRKDMPIALISYAATLAKRNARYARDVFTSPLYQEVFPNMIQDKENWRISDWHVLNHRGYVLAAGTGGPITGHGFGLAIVDDPIENWAAAQSDTLRESIWQWWNGTFMSRIWEDGTIVFMMTRWHEDDLAARILEQDGRVEDGGDWEVCSYAALAEEADAEKGIFPDPVGREVGEALAPSRYSAEYLRALEAKTPSVFQAEYQQRPTAPMGQLFKIGRVNYVTTIPPEIGMLEQDQEELKIVSLASSSKVSLIRYWDFAATEEQMFGPNPAASVGTLFARFDTGLYDALAKQKIYRYYVLDVIRQRVSPEGLASLITQTAAIDGQHVVVGIEQEPGASGKIVIQSYKNMLTGYTVFSDIPSGAKEVRAMPVVQLFNSGNLLVLKAPWNREWLIELAGFPNGRYKDQVDTLSGAFNYMVNNVNKWGQQGFLSV